MTLEVISDASGIIWGSFFILLNLCDIFAASAGAFFVKRRSRDLWTFNKLGEVFLAAAGDFFLGQQQSFPVF